jgi:alpha-L-fucosidase 2
MPSTSPENQFLTDDGRIASAGRSSTNDLSVIADLFDILGRLAALLGREDDPIVVAAQQALVRIPEPRISSDGLVREWAADVAYPDPHHRHVSQLHFVYPGRREISPELRRATERTLDSRGHESTGWSLVWKLALRARLRQPQKVSALLTLIFRNMHVDRGPWSGGLYPNLFSAHPPFAIDGNLGYVAGLSECFLQSDTEGIDLLPAVPAEFPRGRISGLVAIRGFEVDVAWDWSHGAARPTQVTVRSPRADVSGPVVVRFGDTTQVITIAPLGSVDLKAHEFKGSHREAAADHRSRRTPEVVHQSSALGPTDSPLLVERQRSRP